MEQEEIRQLWAEGEDWIIKRQYNQYSYRPDQKYGDWQPARPSSRHVCHGCRDPLR